MKITRRTIILEGQIIPKYSFSSLIELFGSFQSEQISDTSIGNNAFYG